MWVNPQIQMEFEQKETFWFSTIWLHIFDNNHNHRSQAHQRIQSTSSKMGNGQVGEAAK